MSPVIDFFHVDSFEAHEYAPIRRLLGAAARVVLDEGNAWLDADAARAFYDEEAVATQSRPSGDADVVITTQYHRSICRPEYSGAASIRQIYGLLVEKGFTHTIKASLPFDFVLVPGPYSQALLRRVTRPVVVGLPRYDRLLSGGYDRAALERDHGLDPSRPTVLYLPTWAKESSLELPEVMEFITGLTREHNVVFKPHAVSLRMERDRYRYLADAGVTVIERVAPLGELFAMADLCVCDALGGAYWESIFVAQKPTLGIFRRPDYRLINMERRIDDYAVVNRDPGRLAHDLDAARAYRLRHDARLREETPRYLAHTDGSAAARAAAEIRAIAEARPSPARRLVHRLKWGLFADVGPEGRLARAAARNVGRALLGRPARA